MTPAHGPACTVSPSRATPSVTPSPSSSSIGIQPGAPASSPVITHGRDGSASRNTTVTSEPRKCFARTPGASRTGTRSRSGRPAEARTGCRSSACPSCVTTRKSKAPRYARRGSSASSSRANDSRSRDIVAPANTRTDSRDDVSRYSTSTAGARPSTTTPGTNGPSSATASSTQPAAGRKSTRGAAPVYTTAGRTPNRVTPSRSTYHARGASSCSTRDAGPSARA